MTQDIIKVFCEGKPVYVVDRSRLCVTVVTNETHTLIIAKESFFTDQNGKELHGSCFNTSELACEILSDHIRVGYTRLLEQKQRVDMWAVSKYCLE